MEIFKARHLRMVGVPSGRSADRDRHRCIHTDTDLLDSLVTAHTVPVVFVFRDGVDLKELERLVAKHK